MIVTLLFVTLGLLWFLLALRMLLTALTLQRLQPLDGTESPLPRVSVVVAARNEGARLEQTVRRLLKQRLVELEIIVVDDRSTDDTPAVLARLSAEDKRVKPVRVEELPERWLGKCHACHVGSRQATGDWLLFTDGDIWMTPDLVARAVQTANREGAAQVTLAPEQDECTFWGRVAMVGFASAFGELMRRVNQDRPGAFVGIGAFNLVRADLYRGFGGHEPLRLTVADDLKLGLLVRRAGARARAYVGSPDLLAEWADSLPGVWRALEKNHFAAAHYSVVRVFLLPPVCLAVIAVSLVAPLIDPWGGGVALAGLLSLSVPGVVGAHKARYPLLAGALVVLGFLFMVVSVVNSALRTLRQGGVRWRDTFYPLAVLREGDLR